jgi:transcription antitermination factor NusG
VDDNGSDLQWYAVRSKPRRELFAQAELCRREVKTFLPRILEPGRLRDEPTVGPLFPGYLFAQIRIETQYNRVIWTPGVRGFVSFGDVPAPVGDDVIDFLQQRCGAEGIVRALPVFREGELVRVRRGPLSGLVGVVQGDVSGRRRVQVLMELLRRRTQVTLPIELLEHAGAP